MQRYWQPFQDALQRSYRPATVQAAQQFVQTGDKSLLEGHRTWDGEFSDIWRSLPSPDTMDEFDRRVLFLYLRSKSEIPIAPYLEHWFDRESEDDDFHLALSQVYREFGLDEAVQLRLALGNLLTARGRATSSGRYLLSLGDQALKHACRVTQERKTLVALLQRYAPERLGLLAAELLETSQANELDVVCRALLSLGSERCEAAIIERFSDLGAAAAPPQADRNARYCVGYVGITLARHDAARFGELVLKIAGPHVDLRTFNDYLTIYGEQLIPYIVDHMIVPLPPWGGENVFTLTSAILGERGMPVYLAGLDRSQDAIRRAAVAQIILHAPDAQSTAICDALDRLLAETDPDSLIATLRVASRWQAIRIADSLWKLAGDKRKAVRMEAARTLSAIGEAVIPTASQLLSSKRPEDRNVAAEILGGLRSMAAEEGLETRLSVEGRADVRESIRAALLRSWMSRGREFTVDEIEQIVDQSEIKIKWPPAPWVDQIVLPEIRYVDGQPVPERIVRYLLARQASSKEIAPLQEISPLYKLIDRTSSGDFALTLFSGLVSSGGSLRDRWALAVSGILGNDRLVPIVRNQIARWVEGFRITLATQPLQTLALIGTDTALTTLDSIALRFRTKNRTVSDAAAEAFGMAADAAGVAPEVLGDRVVPWLMFETAYPIHESYAGKTIEIAVSMDFKLAYRDVEKNKPIAALPASVSAELKNRCKETSALLRDVAKAQVGRHELLMVRQFEWDAVYWKERYLRHPLLIPFAVRLVWVASGTDGKPAVSFRALQDCTLTTMDDDEASLPDGASIRIAHPLLLGEDDRRRWIESLVDYEIVQPFLQLERPAIDVPGDQASLTIYSLLRGTTLNAMTFRGRSERLGWRRGAIGDGGTILNYVKCFPAASTDVYLGIDGLDFGSDFTGNVTLNEVVFVPTGSVDTSYSAYDDPFAASDPRQIRFDKVSPIVFSETMADLRRIAGTTAESTSNE